MMGTLSMQIGVKVGAPIDPVSWSNTRAMAVEAEMAGFDSIWVEDHHIGPNGGPHDSWSALAGLSAVTSRVRVGSVVSSLNFHPSPAILAHRVATIHDMSGGRLIVGVGSGDPGEAARLGLPGDDAVGRFVEKFEVMRRLLGGERFDFWGEHVRLEDAFLVPAHPVEWVEGLPSVGSPSPVAVDWMVGSTSPRVLDATLPHAAGWTSHWSSGDFQNDPDRYPPLRAAVDERLHDLGRDPANVWRATEVWVQGSSPRGLPIPLPDSTVPGGGSVDTMAEFLERCAAGGIDHLIVLLDPQTPKAVEELAEARRRIEG